MSVFSTDTRAAFAAAYPELPLRMQHELNNHPLLDLERLAQLGESLPVGSIEYNRGDLPLGVTGKPARNGLTIAETIRDIATSGSWAVLKNIEQSAPYAQLVETLLSELRGEIEPRTGAMQNLQGYIFVSSPQAVTPYHFDPEHNILLQLHGSKAMTVFPAGDTRFAADEVHEGYHTGGARELLWDDALADYGREFALSPGHALFVPVMAPHFVRNGPEPSISLSITWRSDWSYEEADARAFNSLLRRNGLKPQAPGRWPQRNRLKAIGWRTLRKVLPRR